MTIENLVEEKVIEMVWFGGIGNDLSNKVFHVRLTLESEVADYAEQVVVSSGVLEVKRLRNKQGKFAKLKKPDRFFYN